MTDIATSGETARRTTDLLLDSIGEILDGLGSLGGPAGKVATVFSGLARVLDASNIAGSLVTLTELSLNAASAIDELSRQTGVGAQRLQELQFAFEVNGLDFNQLDKALSALQTNAGLASLDFDESLVGAFGKLGIQKDELAQTSTSELFDEVLRGLATVQNRFKQAALAAQIFGRDVGPRLLPFVEEGTEGLERLGDQARNFGAVWDRHILQNAAETNREFRGLQRALDTELAESFVALGGPLVGLTDGYLSAARAAAELVDQTRDLEKASTEGIKRRLDSANKQIADQEQIIARQEFEVQQLGGAERAGSEQIKLELELERFQDIRDLRARILKELERRAMEMPESDQRSLLIEGATNLVRVPGQFPLAIAGGSQFAGGGPANAGLPANVVPFPNLEQPKQDVIDFAAVAERAFETYAGSATNAGVQVEDIIGGSLMNMENTLVQFVQTGQLNFRALVDSLIADLLRLTIRAAVLGPIARALGAAFGSGGAGVGVGSSVLSGGNTPFAINEAARGLDFTVPQGFPNDSFVTGLGLTSGERVSVTPVGQTSGSEVNVTVINNSGAEVETRERSNGFGGRDIKVLIGEAVARDLRGGGPTFRAVRDTFGSSALPIAR